MDGQRLKLVAEIATGNTDMGGDRFSESALADIARSVVGRPMVWWNVPNPDRRDGTFPDLHVAGSYLQDGRVFVSILVDNEVCKLLETGGEKLYLVPNMAIDRQHRDGDVTVIDEVRCMSVSLTCHPADRNLTPVRVVPA